MVATTWEKRPGGILGCALEHQMFEEMGKPGFPRRLVGRADLVPEHMRCDRRAVIRNDDDFQAVRQGEMGDLGAARSMASAGDRRREDSGRNAK